MCGEDISPSKQKSSRSNLFFAEKVNYTVTDSGSSYGLWMVLNISQNDYMYSLSRNAGVRITVHQKQETPAISQHGIKASPGFVTSIGVNKKVVSIMSLMSIFSYFLSFERRYFKQNCQFQFQVISKAGYWQHYYFYYATIAYHVGLIAVLGWPQGIMANI